MPRRQPARSVRRFERRGRLLRSRLSVMWAAGLVAGCTELPLSAQQDVNRARDAYLKRDYAAARKTLDDVLGHYGHYTGAAEAYYLRAQVLAETSERAAALRDARQAVELSRDAELAAKAHATAGSLEFESGNMAAAADHYERALTKLPERPPADVIRYRYATCLMQIGRWSDARKALSIVLQRYPSGTIAEHARRLSDWPENYFVIQCGAFHERAGAQQLAQRLQAQGLAARVEARMRQGEKLQYVFVGQYTNYAAAKAALGSVRKNVTGAVIAP